MLPPLNTSQNIKNLQLKIIDPLAKKDTKFIKFFINNIGEYSAHVVAHFDAVYLKNPDIIELTMKRFKNDDFNIKIYFTYNYSDYTGAHYTYKSSDGRGDWKFDYSQLTIRLYCDPYTYMYGAYKRYFFLNMKGNFDHYDMSDICITAEMKYSNLIIIPATENFINFHELPGTQLSEPLYIREVLDDAGWR